LNYAEAANEAYGAGGKAPNAALTALQAVNVIRARAGMPDVRAEFTGSKETLRVRIKNERIVELCFEGFHYYCDIRRWKDAPELMSGTLYGIRAVKQSDASFTYTRVPLDADRQVAWKNAMYYLPFRLSDLEKLGNYVPNESW
jgi:hypothetical protein